MAWVSADPVPSTRDLIAPIFASTPGIGRLQRVSNPSEPARGEQSAQLIRTAYGSDPQSTRPTQLSSRAGTKELVSAGERERRFQHRVVDDYLMIQGGRWPKDHSF
jgi:hypothetical protein